MMRVLVLIGLRQCHLRMQSYSIKLQMIRLYLHERDLIQ